MFFMKKWLVSLLFATLCCLVSINFGYGQSLLNTKITNTFSDQDLSSILEQLEADYNLLFYFKPDELPQNTYNLSFAEEPLENVLTQLLENSTLGYLVYRDYTIIIAPATTLGEVYTANYYNALKNSITTATDTTAENKTIIIGQTSKLSPSGKAKIKGQVLDEQTAEPIIGATLFLPSLNSGTASDIDGFFELEMPPGNYTLTVQYVGYQEQQQTISVKSDGQIELRLEKTAINLNEVIVEAQAPDDNVENAQISVTRLDVKEIKKLPAFLGEPDIIKSLLLQPGVSTIGEGATGINVRGGEVDQNLFLLDDGFIFNASHLLGFFSTFQSDLIRDVALYKGNIPAQYGGRLASVLEVKMRDGDFQKFRTKGGLGPVSSRIVLEGPLKKNKSAVIAGFRSTYSNWLLGLVNVPEVRRSSAFFYDTNLRLTHRFDEKNTLILSAYAAHDDFEFNEQFGFEYTTLMGQLSYKKIFSDRMFSNTSLTYSQYNSIQTDLEGTAASNLESTLSYAKFREHITFTPLENLQLDGGLSSILYLQQPGALTPFGVNSTIIPGNLEDEQGLESALFLNAEWQASPAFTISGGLRFGLYQYLGAKSVFQYNGLPDVEQITDTLVYNPGQIITTYSSLEPRVSLRYRLNPEMSVKAGYSRTAQFINQISNADVPTPTSQWQLSTTHIKPQRSHNFSMGLFRNFKDNNWETSIETYFRVIDQLFDYRDFAILTINDHIETELLAGEGRAYGMELSIKRNRGNVHGWLSYTLSRTERLVQGINNDNWYPSNFDKPHDLSLVLNFQPNQRHTITVNFNYSTGRPTTPPVGRYQANNGLIIPIYTERNQRRIPDYHRLDIAYTIGRGYNKTKKFKTSWTISLYNVYGRQNAFSVFFTQSPFQEPVANQLAVLGSIFPALTFNFETI